MADDYNYKMSDLEYKKYKLKQSIESANEEFINGEHRQKKKAGQLDNYVGARRFECNVSELAQSDHEINCGDEEDNVTLNSDELEEHSLSLAGESGQE